jgi:hypothetical protein
MKTGVQSTYFDVGLWGPGAKKGCPYYISIKPNSFPEPAILGKEREAMG